MVVVVVIASVTFSSFSAGLSVSSGVYFGPRSAENSADSRKSRATSQDSKSLCQRAHFTAVCKQAEVYFPTLIDVLIRCWPPWQTR